MALKWTTAPGGKRYETTDRGATYEIVKQNTAAGGPRWKAYRTLRGETYVLYKGNSLPEAKRACEEKAGSRPNAQKRIMPDGTVLRIHTYGKEK